MSMDGEWKLIVDKCASLGIKPPNRSLYVSINGQVMRFYNEGALEKAYVVSTSCKPPSNIRGSLGTPRGMHAIAEKVGGGIPPGIVFKGRVATGYHFNEYLDRGEADESDNLITTRILWLKGLEPAVNEGGEVDTLKRYIYIHGTNREDRLGQPQSAGCVLVSNLDAIELFEKTRVGDLVLIGD